MISAIAVVAADYVSIFWNSDVSHFWFSLSLVKLSSGDRVTGFKNYLSSSNNVVYIFQDKYPKNPSPPSDYAPGPMERDIKSKCPCTQVSLETRWIRSRDC